MADQLASLPWVVVCPDGIIRKHRYRNQGDAECDARVFTRRGCALHAGPKELGGCPRGTHVVKRLPWEDPS